MYSIEGEHLRQLLLRARGALWYRQNREFLADCAQLFFSATDHFGSATVAFCIWLLRVRLGIPALFRSFERCIDRNQVLLGTMNKTCRRTRLFEQLLLTGSVVFFRLSDIVVQREVRLGEARSCRIPTWARVPRSAFLDRFRLADNAFTTSARLAVAGLRNEGLVEERVRGVIRLTALGYKKYKNAPLPYAYTG
jgi:hypothetical protein